MNEAKRRAGIVQNHGDFKNGESGKVPDAYWGPLAKKLLHPVQIGIIEALWRSDGPLTPSDLARLVEGATPAEINYHLRRLRTIKAVTYPAPPSRLDPFDIPFRLVQPDDEC